jgi:hypothetical protein
MGGSHFRQNNHSTRGLWLDLIQALYFMILNKIKNLILASLVSILFMPAVASETLVFVGEYIDVREWPYSKEELSACNCIFMDMRYKATYKVKQVLHGKYDKEEITFVVHDHYGFPDFAKQKAALLYMAKNNENYVQLKYAWDEVSPISGGGYAYCTDASFMDDEYKSKVKNYSYNPPVYVDLSHSSEYVVNEYRNNPLYKVEGDVANCVKGISVEEFFNIKWPQIVEDYDLDKKELLKEQK